jgi:hypothetical protein
MRRGGTTHEFSTNSSNSSTSSSSEALINDLKAEFILAQAFAGFSKAFFSIAGIDGSFHNEAIAPWPLREFLLTLRTLGGRADSLPSDSFLNNPPCGRIYPAIVTNAPPAASFVDFLHGNSALLDAIRTLGGGSVSSGITQIGKWFSGDSRFYNLSAALRSVGECNLQPIIGSVMPGTAVSGAMPGPLLFSGLAEISMAFAGHTASLGALGVPAQQGLSSEAWQDVKLLNKAVVRDTISALSSQQHFSLDQHIHAEEVSIDLSSSIEPTLAVFLEYGAPGVVTFYTTVGVAWRRCSISTHSSGVSFKTQTDMANGNPWQSRVDCCSVVPVVRLGVKRLFGKCSAALELSHSLAWSETIFSSKFSSDPKLLTLGRRQNEISLIFGQQFNWPRRAL